MRDFRDAKAMAQTLRESLSHKAMTISHGESLELVSKMLGLSDWNTLSAMLQAGRGEPTARAKTTTARYPAMPLRGVVPFPTATYPFVFGRQKTVQAIKLAWERERELVLAVQRQETIDEPGFDDVHQIGVRAELLGVSVLPDGTRLAQARAIQRVAIRRWTVAEGAFQAEAVDLDEGPVGDVADLVRRAVRRLEGHAAAGKIPMPDAYWFSFEPTRDPGRVADTIASRLILPISDRYELLATLDPVLRLQRVDALLDLSARLVSPLLAKVKQRAFREASQRHQMYATLEHLLLALIEDPDASALMRGCSADLDALKNNLVRYIDNELKTAVVLDIKRARPTAAFQRVEQRAALEAQLRGHPVVTGAHVLLGIFPETQSPAARFLAEQGVSLGRAAELVTQGLGKRNEDDRQE
jgi:ATP-dependent Lon protease